MKLYKFTFAPAGELKNIGQEGVFIFATYEYKTFSEVREWCIQCCEEVGFCDRKLDNLEFLGFFQGKTITSTLDVPHTIYSNHDSWYQGD